MLGEIKIRTKFDTELLGTKFEKLSYNQGPKKSNLNNWAHNQVNQQKKYVFNLTLEEYKGNFK